MTRQIPEMLAAPGPCSYLPGKTSRTGYTSQTPTQAELTELVRQGWVYSAHGQVATQTRCMTCSSCWPIRVKALEFTPGRSQLRVQRANHETQLVIGKPTIDAVRLDLYRRHHLARQAQKGWASKESAGAAYIESVINSSVPMSEWAFYRDGKLVAVSYVTNLDDAFLGTYYMYDPDYSHLSLGTWMVMTLIREAAARGFDYAYLGTFVSGCGSLEYKSGFRPNQVRKPFSNWQDFK